MKQHAILWLFILGVVRLSVIAETPLQLIIKKTPAENLLKNADFSVAGGVMVPTEWGFNNYSKKPGFSYSTNNKVFRLETDGGLYGYLIQPRIPVKEGNTYYAEAQVRLNSRALLWVMTTQYSDGRSAHQGHRSATRLYAIANPDHGEKLTAELKYFINPDFLLPISETEWNRCAVEFTVPEGHGVTEYDFRIGAYGGARGWIEIKEPTFSLSIQRVELTITGENLVKLSVCHPDGTVIASFELQPKKNEQQVNFTLNSRLIQHFAEITNSDGITIRREL